VVVGYDLPSSELAVELARTSDSLWAAVGVHPHHAVSLDEAAMARLRGLAKSCRVVAIGEIGLDFYRDLSPRDKQINAFRHQLALSAELSLPVIMHCRNAQEPLLAIAAEQARPGMVWHCFDGTREQAARALGLGMLLGFAGTVTYRRRASLRQIAAETPQERILLETDSPYLTPEGKGQRDNEPANIPIIAEHVAQARRMSAEQVMRLARENARRLFALDATGDRASGKACG